MSQSAMEPRDQELRRNALGIWHIGGMSMAWMGIAIATYFVIPFMEQATGPITPLVFLLLIFAMMPTALSYAIMNNRRPSAGGAFTWLWESITPAIGVWLGWLVLTLYGIVGVVLQPLIGGITFNSLLTLMGVHTSFLTAIIGGLLTVAAVAILSYAGVRRSTRNVLIFFVIELAFVIFLALYIIIYQGVHGHLSLTPLNPSAGTGGFEGLKIAILFGIFSIAGFDIVATVAEETEAPRKWVPRATIWVTILAGLIWAFTSYGLAVAVPVKTMNQYLNASAQNGAVYLVAAKYLGAGKVFVILTSASAILAILGSVMLAGARMLFALAREGLAPAWFGRVHPKHGTPWNAQLGMFALAAVVPILIAIWQGHDVTAAYGWLGQSFVFFVLVPYIFVCLGNILYHLRYRRSEFNMLTNGILPAIGIVIDGWLLYDAFFKALLPLPFKTGSSIAYFAVGWAVLGAIWTVAVLARRKRTHTEGLYLFSEAEEGAGARVVTLEEEHLATD